MAVTKAFANADALIEQGYNYLSDAEYGLAAEYFHRTLDLDAKVPRAYWGLILAERQARNADGRDLIDSGFCIDQDSNFRRACQYAGEEEKAGFCAVARACAFQCHAKIVELIAEQKLRPASLRAKQYASSSYADTRLLDADTVLLRENAFAEPAEETPRALLSLLELHKDASFPADFDKDDRVSEKVRTMYTAFMDWVFALLMQREVFPDPEEEKDSAKLNRITGDDPDYYQLCRKVALRSFGETRYHQDILIRKGLAALWADPRNNAKDAAVGTDGKPGTVAERWLFVAEEWTREPPIRDNTPSYFEYSYMVLDFLAKAFETGADRTRCIAAEQRCIEDTMQLINARNHSRMLVKPGFGSLYEYDRYTEIIDHAPDKSAASVVVIKRLITDQRWWDALSEEYGSCRDEVQRLTETVESKKRLFSWSDNSEIDTLNNKIKECAASYQKEFAKKEAIIEQYSKDALSSESGIDGLSVRLTEEDIRRFHTDFEARQKEFEALSERLLALKNARFSLLRGQINRKSLGYCIMSAVLLLISAFFFYQSLKCFQQPALMRVPSRTLFLTVFLSITVVIGISLSLLSFCCARSTVFYKGQEQIPDRCRAWNYSQSLHVPVFLVFLLTVLLFSGACVFLILGYVRGVSAALRSQEIDALHIAVCVGAIITALFSINSAVFAFKSKTNGHLKKNPFLYLMPILYFACLAFLLYY